MKKLMIAAAIVCAAAMSQAAVANWKVGASNVYNGSGTATTDDKYSGAAYIFLADAGAASQQALFNAFTSATEPFDWTKQGGYVKTGSVSAGSLGSSQAANQFTMFEQGSGGSHSFFFVLVQDDKIYFSETKSGATPANDSPMSIAFGNQKSTSGLPNSSLAATTTFTTGQWVSVPEPTSGLLLLLGVAGLALKRRRA